MRSFLLLLVLLWPATLLALPVAEGPWSGGVTPHSAVVVARLDTSRFASLEVSADRDFARSQTIAAARNLPDTPREIVRFNITGLRADTLYHYRIVAGRMRDDERTGTFRTLPAEGEPASFKFAFGSCAQTGSAHAVFSEIRYQAPLFFLHVGDLHYEDIAKNDPALFRAAYAAALASPTQGALYRQLPIAYIWDDHDYGPNNSDGTSPSREAAQQVYREYVPHYPLPADAALADSPLAERPITQAFTVGRVRFLLLDTRSQRDPVTQPDTPAKTMLGTWQRAWLQNELLAGRDRHALTFIVSSVPWTSNETERRDNWGRFTAERALLATWMVENGIRNVCFLGGDAHMLAADDGTHNTYAADGIGPGFPALQAGPLDRSGSVKGGPWSVAPVLPDAGEGQFGLVEITDSSAHIDVLFRGLNQDSREKLRLAFRVPGAP